MSFRIYFVVEALRFVLVRDLAPGHDEVTVIWIVLVTNGAHNESVESENHVEVNL